MRAAKEEQTGGIGANEVAANFERIGWGPVENRQHDLGTDLLVQARDDRRFDRGLIVGVQVKGGSSWFRQPENDEDGTVRGWWYYEPDADHFDDWVCHGLPHLLVLHDLDTRISYWVHVAPELVEITGKGAKILVPAAQTVDLGHLDALLAVASTGKPAVALEGSAWGAGARAFAPGRRLRHALLVPRLVAPHRNAGFARAIDPEEAVALLVQARLHDVDQFGRAHDSVPGLATATEHRDWRWRFAAAVRRVVLGEDRKALLPLIAAAPNPPTRAAAAVFAAAVLIEDGDADAAATVLSSALGASDDLVPVDLAWVLIQRARARAEAGDVAGAREDAAASRRAVVGDRDDVTASVIASAAAWLVFSTAAWGEDDLEDVVAAGDTAGSWWRTATVAVGAEEAVQRQFATWARDTTVTLGGEDVVNNQLYAAALNANLSGEHGAWRGILGLFGRAILLEAQADDGDRISQGLAELRRAGDDKAVQLAMKRIHENGPSAVLRDAVCADLLQRSTHTTLKADLAVVQYGGDCADGQAAGEVARSLLTALESPSTLIARTTPSFLLLPALVDALAGVTLAAEDAHEAIVQHLVTLPPLSDQLLATSYAGVALSLPPRAASAGTSAAIRAAGLTQPDERLASALLNLAGDDEAIRELVSRASGGDRSALSRLDVTRLSGEGAANLIEKYAASVERVGADAVQGAFSFPVLDPGQVLALLNVWHPEHARWEPLLRLLEHPSVSGSSKRATCVALARNRDNLPATIRERLATVVPGIPRTDHVDGLIGGELAGAADWLAAAVGALDERTAAEHLTRLLRGTATERADAARLMAALGRPQDDSALLVLTTDRDPSVRAAAAFAASQRVAAADDTNQVLAAAVQSAFSDPGTVVPLAAVSGVSAVRDPMPHALLMLRALEGHVAAKVRAAASAVVDR